MCLPTNPDKLLSCPPWGLLGHLSRRGEVKNFRLVRDKTAGKEEEVALVSLWGALRLPSLA